MSDRDLFIAALQRDDPAERAAYLEAACAGDAELRERIDRLLQAHADAGSFLDPPHDPEATAEQPPGERPGGVIGPYKLLQVLGEGGMGTVFLAEQDAPVRRRVALKVVKAGLDTARVLARFEAERQALALMDHPNIAKVFDAGATPLGRPYFVMELIQGLPINRYCDQERLSPRERLALFLPVCAAVQHAHQKGVIHRDLKPSNILVGLYDGRPVPKVIDFGVAKAAGQRLADRTVFTEAGQMVGTLEYMAPEQAELNNLDIDTRADIYSLGVILYELLAGSPPFTAKQLRGAAFAEMLRIIREVEPPTPSTKLSGSEELPSIAANRKLEPKRLTKLVHGELDWITMKCLEKERGRRYETANGLARDVERYLTDEPVVAGPPSRFYRMRKFLRRNRGSAMAAGSAVVLTFGGLATSNWLIRQEQKRTLAALVQAADNRKRARDALDQLSSDVIGDWLARQPRLSGYQKQVLEATLARYEELTREAGDTPKDRLYLARAYSRVGDYRGWLGQRTESDAAFARSVGLFQSLAQEFPAEPDYPSELARTFTNHGSELIKVTFLAQARASTEAARDILEPLVAAHPDRRGDVVILGGVYCNLGIIAVRTGDPRAALGWYDKSAARLRPLASDGSAETVTPRVFLGNALVGRAEVFAELKDWDRALLALEDARPIQERLVAEYRDEPQYRRELAANHYGRGRYFVEQRKTEEAVAAFDMARGLRERLVGDYPGMRQYVKDLANVYEDLAYLRSADRPQEALRDLRAALGLRERLAQGPDPLPQYTADLASTHKQIGDLYLFSLKSRKDAREPFEAARRLLERLVAEHPGDAGHAVSLGGTYCNLGNLAREDEHPGDALPLYDKAIATLTPVVAAATPPRATRKFLRNSHSGRAAALAELNRHAEALADLDRAVALADGPNPAYQLRRADALLRLGDHSAATAVARAVAADKALPAGDIYDVACVFSLCAAAVARDEKVLPPERARTAEAYAARAMTELRRATAAGYRDVAHIQADTDLDAIRGRDEFKKLLKELEAKPKTPEAGDR
jgi:serine/threonine protein kinase